MFNNALQPLNTYWDEKMHNGIQVTSVGISASAENSNNSKTAVKGIFDTSLARIQEDGDLLLLVNKWKFYLKNMDHRLEIELNIQKGIISNLTCACYKNEPSTTEHKTSIIVIIIFA